MNKVHHPVCHKQQYHHQRGKKGVWFIWVGGGGGGGGWGVGRDTTRNAISTEVLTVPYACRVEHLYKRQVLQ